MFALLLIWSLRTAANNCQSVHLHRAYLVCLSGMLLQPGMQLCVDSCHLHEPRCKSRYCEARSQS